MHRNVLKVVCIVLGILFLLFSIFTVFSVISGLERISTSGGIIGGAGRPTVGFLLQTCPTFHPAIVTFLLFAATGSVLIFGRKAKK